MDVSRGTLSCLCSAFVELNKLYAALVHRSGPSSTPFQPRAFEHAPAAPIV